MRLVFLQTLTWGSKAIAILGSSSLNWEVDCPNRVFLISGTLESVSNDLTSVSNQGHRFNRCRCIYILSIYYIDTNTTSAALPVGPLGMRYLEILLPGSYLLVVSDPGDILSTPIYLRGYIHGTCTWHNYLPVFELTPTAIDVREARVICNTSLTHRTMWVIAFDRNSMRSYCSASIWQALAARFTACSHNHR